MSRRLDEILKVHFSAVEMASRAEDLVSQTTEDALEQACISMRRVTVGLTGIVAQLPEISDELVKRFYTAANSGEFSLRRAFSSNRDKRRLAHAMNVTISDNTFPAIVDGPHFESAMQLLFHDWRDVYFGTLIHLVLSRWCDLTPVRLDKLLQLLHERTVSYAGNRTLMNAARVNSEFLLHKSGALNYGADILRSGKDPSDACANLGLPDSWSGLSYFDEVLVGYINAFIGCRRRVSELKAVLNLVEAREGAKGSVSSDLAKKCMVRILIWAESLDEQIKDCVSQAAVRLIGDSIDDVKWCPWSRATAEDLRDIKKARSILGAMIAAHFIELFFERIAHDNRRSAFWKDYYKSFPYVKVFCPEMEMKRMLRGHPELADTFSDRVGVLEGTKDTAALVMHVKNYCLVEFSKAPNAFYAYKDEEEAVHFSQLEKSNKQLTSHVSNAAKALLLKSKGKCVHVNSLKRPSVVSRLSKFNWKTRNEGWISHNGDWETLLRRWLAFHLKI